MYQEGQAGWYCNENQGQLNILACAFHPCRGFHLMQHQERPLLPCHLVADAAKNLYRHALLTSTNQVQVLDAWGNATCPQDFLPFEVKVQSEAAEPDLSTYPVDDRCLRFGFCSAGCSLLFGSKACLVTTCLLCNWQIAIRLAIPCPVQAIRCCHSLVVARSNTMTSLPLSYTDIQHLSWKHVLALDCRGVATITGIAVYRQDVPASDSQHEDGTKSAEPQLHQLLIWPECDKCEDPLMQQAVQLAEPLNRVALQLSVLPSNMPAELLMTYQGEVRGAAHCHAASARSRLWRWHKCAPTRHLSNTAIPSHGVFCTAAV